MNVQSVSFPSFFFFLRRGISVFTFIVKNLEVYVARVVTSFWRGKNDKCMY